MFKLKSLVVCYLPLIVMVSTILYVSYNPKVEQMKKILVIVIGSSIALIVLVKQFVPISPWHYLLKPRSRSGVLIS